VIIEAAVHAGYLFSSFSLNKSELLLLSTAKERVLENQHLVVLLHLMEVVHVELPIWMSTCILERIPVAQRKRSWNGGSTWEVFRV
jgi:hypothetical protein